MTGSVPGRARSTAQAWVLGSAPKAVGAQLKILLRVSFEADDDLVAVDQGGGHGQMPAGERKWKSVACWKRCAA